MSFLKSLALATLASNAMAHMKMRSPVPFGASSLNNFPLLGSGSDYPCKLRAGAYDDEGAAAANIFALGSSVPLTFTGSAVHGGGSCQIALTTDQNPTASSVFRVIHSYIGGCPARNIDGNFPADANFLDPNDYTIPIPNDIPAGKYTLAWVWHNRIGNMEMYMNCAPVTLTGNSAAGAQDTFNSLPEIQKFNLDPFSAKCNTSFLRDADTLAWDLLYPEPGRSVEFFNHTPAAFERTNPNVPSQNGKCLYSGSGSGSGGNSSPASSAVASSAAATTAPAATKTATATVLNGGVFVTANPAASSSPTTTSTPAATPTTGASSGSGSGSGSGSSSGSSSGSGSGSSSGSGSGSSSGSGYSTGTACSTEGSWNCVGGTQFQQCASGMWSALESVAAGTTCSPGQSTTLTVTASRKKAKRAVGFRA